MGVVPTTAEGRVLEVLERTGVFRVGGTLVGSMALRHFAAPLMQDLSASATP